MTSLIDRFRLISSKTYKRSNALLWSSKSGGVCITLPISIKKRLRGKRISTASIIGNKTIISLFTIKNKRIVTSITNVGIINSFIGAERICGNLNSLIIRRTNTIIRSNASVIISYGKVLKTNIIKFKGMVGGARVPKLGSLTDG